MPIPYIDLTSQYLTIKDEIDDAIQQVLLSGQYIGGEFVRKFEEDYAQVYGCKHCIGVGNGTDAIFIALKSLGICEGDEVITTCHSWVSTAEAIVRTGATPVFVDTEEDYYTIDPNKIASNISDQTKAILPVHLFGQMCDMPAIMEIAEKHSLYVIEDCAQAHFSELNGIKAGLWGHVAAFSFYPTKNLGAFGDGGCIITNNDDLMHKCRSYANHGGLKKHEHFSEGMNSRLDSLQAAILSVKLKYVEGWIAEKIVLAMKYNAFFENNSEIIAPKIRSNSKHTFHVYAIKVENRIEKIAEWGNYFRTELHYPQLLSDLPVFSIYNKNEMCSAKKYNDQLLSIPLNIEVLESLRSTIDSKPVS